MIGNIKLASGSRRVFCLLVFAGSLVNTQAQGVVTIGFEGPPVQPVGTGYFIGEYIESGIWFRPLGVVEPGNGFVLQRSGYSLYPDNGTAYVQTSLGDSLVFSFLDDSLFSLSSVDLAEYSTVVPDAATVQFIGYYSGGGTITTSFTTDGIIDGTGPLPDFQTFAFGAGWTGLSRVEVPGFGWSMDNVVVGVPEPTAGALLLLGGTMLWFWRGRRS